MVHFYAQILLGLQIFFIFFKIFNFDFDYGFHGVEKNVFRLLLMLPLYGVIFGWW